MDMAQILSILRDQIWNSLDVVVALALAAGGYYMVQRRNRMALSYDTLVVPLVRLEESIHSRVQISMDGTPIENLYFVSVSVTNTGRVPIRPDDYDGPIVIDFGVSEAIIESRAPNSSPPYLADDIASRGSFDTGESDEWSIERVLLNPGESFTIRALVSKVPNPKVRARIAGVNQVTAYTDRTPRYIQFVWMLLVLFCFGSLGLFTYWAIQHESESHWTQTFVNGIIAGFVFTFLVVLLSDQIRKTRFASTGPSHHKSVL